jgi:hypothetical protein
MSSGLKDVFLSENFTSVVVDESSNTASDLPAFRKTRDFLDMRNLFTYVIPMLGAANGYVINWTEKYGSDVVDVDLSKYSNGDPSIMFEQQKKESLRKLWNMYSPWVHQLDDATASHETARYAGERLSIPDPIYPASYYAFDRPMIFGAADMASNNMQISDLTQTEYKIMKVLDDTAEDFKYLMNYLGYSDEVLLASAAMQATFNFNKEFSTIRILGESNVLYPQGYELKNFNYDAFLRLILLNSTGENLMQTENLYSTILKKTSFITGVILIVNDIIAVYVLPTVKIILLFMLFLLGMLLCISCFLSPMDRMVKTIFDAIGMPLIMFMCIALSHAFITSLFMGEGLVDLVGSESIAIVTNDPTVTLLLLILVNTIISYMFIRLLLRVLKSFKAYSTGSMLAAAGIIGATAGALVAPLRKRRALDFRSNKYLRKIRDTLSGKKHGKIKRGWFGSGGSQEGAEQEAQQAQQEALAAPEQNQVEQAQSGELMTRDQYNGSGLPDQNTRDSRPSWGGNPVVDSVMAGGRMLPNENLKGLISNAMVNGEKKMIDSQYTNRTKDRQEKLHYEVGLHIGKFHLGKSLKHEVSDYENVLESAFSRHEEKMHVSRSDTRSYYEAIPEPTVTASIETEAGGKIFLSPTRAVSVARDREVANAGSKTNSGIIT